MLYGRYFDRLVAFASRFLEDTQKAEDAVQEVFIRIIDKPDSFDPARRFSTWVFTLTANACKNQLRNESSRMKIVTENLRLNLEKGVEMHHSHDLSVLKRCLNEGYEELNEKEKWLFVLRFEEQLSIKEISEITSYPEGSVKSGIYYLLRKLGKHVKHFNYG